jgi:hypothetical protein
MERFEVESVFKYPYKNTPRAADNSRGSGRPAKEAIMSSIPPTDPRFKSPVFTPLPNDKYELLNISSESLGDPANNLFYTEYYFDASACHFQVSAGTYTITPFAEYEEYAEFTKIAHGMAWVLSDLECIETDYWPRPDLDDWDSVWTYLRLLRNNPYFQLTNKIISHLDEVEELFRPKIEIGKPAPLGYVYVLRAETGHYKIGKTSNPKDRIRTFGVKLPFRVEYELVIPSYNHHVLEKKLHERFAYCRLDGEWFLLTQEDVDRLRQEYINE